MIDSFLSLNWKYLPQEINNEADLSIILEPSKNKPFSYVTFKSNCDFVFCYRIQCSLPGLLLIQWNVLSSCMKSNL